MRAISKAGRLLSVCALLVGLIVATPATAHADVIPPSGQWVELFLPYEPQPGYSLCLDVPGGSTRQGLRLQVFRCHGYASDGGPQRWVFVHVSDGSYQIENLVNHLCVTTDAQVSSTPRYGYIVQEPCDFFPGQEWNIVPHPDNPDLLFQLSSANFTDRCLWGPASSGTVIWANCQTYIPNEVWAMG
jgi:hypothetical protein